MQKDYMNQEHYYYDPKNGIVYKETTKFTNNGNGVYDVSRAYTDVSSTYEQSDYENKGLRVISSHNVEKGSGNYKIVIEPSIEKINSSKPEDAVYRIALERGLAKMLDPDAIRENALRAGGAIKKQYIYSRLATRMLNSKDIVAASLAATKPYIGSISIKKGKNFLNPKKGEVEVHIMPQGDEKYAELEVKRIEQKVHDSRAYKRMEEWEAKYKEMEEEVIRESVQYRREGKKGLEVEYYAMGMISGKSLDIPRDNLQGHNIVVKVDEGEYVPKHQKGGEGR